MDHLLASRYRASNSNRNALRKRSSGISINRDLNAGQIKKFNIGIHVTLFEEQKRKDRRETFPRSTLQGGAVVVDKAAVHPEGTRNRRYEAKYLGRPMVCVRRPIQTSFSPSLAFARPRSVLATGGCTGMPCQRDRLHRFVPFVLK